MNVEWNWEKIYADFNKGGIGIYLKPWSKDLDWGKYNLNLKINKYEQHILHLLSLKYTAWNAI